MGTEVTKGSTKSFEKSRRKGLAELEADSLFGWRPVIARTFRAESNVSGCPPVGAEVNVYSQGETLVVVFETTTIAVCRQPEPSVLAEVRTSQSGTAFGVVRQSQVYSGEFDVEITEPRHAIDSTPASQPKDGQGAVVSGDLRPPA